MGGGRDASTIEMRKAFLRKALVSHPDRGGDSEHFSLVFCSYRVLGPFGHFSIPLARWAQNANDGHAHGGGIDCVLKIIGSENFWMAILCVAIKPHRWLEGPKRER